MRVIAQSSLKAFWTVHPETEPGLRVWLRETRQAEWRSMADILTRWPKAKLLNGERVRFPIAGGDYRLIAAFQFGARIAWIKFLGTHTEYDRIDALTVAQF